MNNLMISLIINQVLDTARGGIKIITPSNPPTTSISKKKPISTKKFSNSVPTNN
jgi:hypothetical protein